MIMKLVSFNVAGFRACLNKGFEDFFYDVNADIMCLQEIKVLESQISFKPNNYFTYINSAEKKGYSGTLIYSKIKPIACFYGMGKKEHDSEGRLITLEFKDFYLVNVYVPNVKRTLERLPYRMTWEKDFKKYIKNLMKKKEVIICGDFNVAHAEIDIKNAKQNIGNAGFTYEEREKFTELLNIGLIDTYRYFNQNQEGAYTWWSYMKDVRKRNIGWRIDYFLVSKNLINRVKKVHIYKDVLGSDHCPIGLEF